ncbi:MAG: SDR family NAD(P)-dependent oxidoreductase, partial [Ignavibacteriaceae bacterium]
MSKVNNESYWAVILGSSSGFGEAAALQLAKDGYNIIGVHLDRQATMPNVERIIEQIKSCNVDQVFYNVNAADEEKRKEIIDDLLKRTGGKPQVKVVMHSLAFGTLKPFVPK